MARCLLALGSNLGDRHAILAQACAEVDRVTGCQLLARSRWYDTAPIGGVAGQGEFLNGAILVETMLRPQQLALAMQAIETGLGRERVVRWDARTLDIDILLYGAEVVDTEALTVPHPRMAFRNFVLEPAAEIAGALIHPTSGWTVARLWAHLQNSPRFLIVTAAEKSLADGLASQLSQTLGCSVWPSADKNTTQASVSQLGAGVQFPANTSGTPPVIVTLSPNVLGDWATTQFTQKDFVRPAVVIVLDPAKPNNLSAEDDELNSPGQNYLGLGPVARITTADPATVLQEAEAALRCIWPDIE